MLRIIVKLFKMKLGIFSKNTVFLTLYFKILGFNLKLPPQTMTSLGSKIKKIRELRNFTQEYMAEKLQLTQQGYGKLERGDVDIPFKRLEQIAQTLGVKVEDITRFDESIVFNNHTGAFNCGFTNHYHQQSFENERKAYQEQINSLKSEVEYLKGIINKILPSGQS
jgi:transcriptional regulator with XRE-family HTH domain